MLDKKLSSLVCLLVLLVANSFLSGCNMKFTPELTEKDKKEFEETKYPFASSTLYVEALRKMGTVINNTVDYRKVVQPKEIGNTAGGNDVPLNLTNMVISSISEFAGPRFVIAPSDPGFVINDFQTGGSGTRVLPDIIIGGSITEYDKDIEGDSSDITADIAGSIKGNAVETGAKKGDTRKLSRVVLDLYLLDYKTQVVIPGAHVSNTVHVLELGKDQGFDFEIFNSQMGVSGRIDQKQGVHKAVRNLVEYSVLQLFGKYYDLPYWKLLGVEQSDQNVLQSLTDTFAKKNRQQQVTEIQKWLNRYNLGSVTSPIDGTTINRVPVDGILDPVTQEYINKFTKQYAPGTSQTTLAETYAKLIEHGAFIGMTPPRSPEDVAAARKELSDQIGTTKDSTNLIMMKSK